MQQVSCPTHNLALHAPRRTAGLERGKDALDPAAFHSVRTTQRLPRHAQGPQDEKLAAHRAGTRGPGPACRAAGDLKGHAAADLDGGRCRCRIGLLLLLLLKLGLDKAQVGPGMCMGIRKGEFWRWWCGTASSASPTRPLSPDG